MQYQRQFDVLNANILQDYFSGIFYKIKDL